MFLKQGSDMTCTIENARLCRSCDLVTADAKCDLCEKRTVPHPESASPDQAQYCVACGEECTAAEVIVRTFKDDPYCQLEDGGLITVCLTCEKVRIEEEGETAEDPGGQHSFDDVPNKTIESFILSWLDDYTRHESGEVMLDVDKAFEKAGMPIVIRQLEHCVSNLIGRKEIIQRWSDEDYSTLQRVRKRTATIPQRSLFLKDLSDI